MKGRIYFPAYSDPGLGLFRHLTDYEIAMRWKEYKIEHPTNSQYNHVDDPFWRATNPMVYYLDGSHQVQFNKAWQYVLYDMNPGIDPKKWRILWDWMRAYSNGLGKGFDTRSLLVVMIARVFGFLPSTARSLLPVVLQSDYVPVQDFINEKDLSPSNPLLAKDKVRVNGNTVVKILRVEGEFGVVQTLDGNSNPPPVKDILKNPHLWFYANNVHYSKLTKSQLISPFNYNLPQGCRIPLVAKKEVKVFMPALQPASECPPSPDIPDYPVDPYKTYLYI